MAPETAPAQHGVSAAAEDEVDSGASPENDGKSEPGTPNSSRSSGEDKLSGSSTKQLRTVAFPPLPRERGSNNDGDSGNNEADGRSSTQDSIPTPSKSVSSSPMQ